MPRRRAIAAAVVRRAEMRAALENLAWNPDVGLARVETVALGPTARILWNAARLCGICLVPAGPPVVRPFPDIADHVVNAVAVPSELFKKSLRFIDPMFILLCSNEFCKIAG